jgi:hypothetical protein
VGLVSGIKVTQLSGVTEQRETSATQLGRDHMVSTSGRRDFHNSTMTDATLVTRIRIKQDEQANPRFIKT